MVASNPWCPLACMMYHSNVCFYLHVPFFPASLFLFSSSFLKILFIYLRERERERAWEGGGPGRSRLPAERGAQRKAQFWDSRIMFWAEDRCLADWATQAPPLLFFFLMPLYYLTLHFLYSASTGILAGGWRVDRGWLHLCEQSMLELLHAVLAFCLSWGCLVEISRSREPVCASWNRVSERV